MNQARRNFILIVILMLSIILLPVLSATSMIDLMEDNDLFTDDDFSVITIFPVAWTRVPVHQMSVLLRLGISIFALFVVYLGGRSKAKRFNDRTLDSIKSLITEFSKTALLLRAVFNFLFFDPSPPQTNDNLFKVLFQL